jgi:hypothetical protein
MRKKKFLLIPITVVALLAGGLIQVSILEVKDGKSGEILFYTRVVEGDIFEFNYIHSVEKTLVEGTFLIEKDGALRIMETRFSSYGAGLPNIHEKTLRKNGWFVTEGGERLENLRFFFSPINRPVLKFRDKETALRTKKNEGGLLEISIRNNLFILQALRELYHLPFDH